MLLLLKGLQEDSKVNLLKEGELLKKYQGI